MVSIWNKITVLNPVQEQHVLSGYKNHRHNLGEIQRGKKSNIDNKLPFEKTQRSLFQSYSKPQRERDLHIINENENLKNKLKQIHQRPGDYNKKQIEKNQAPVAKSLNGVYRVMQKKKVYEENLGMAYRMKNTQSTVDFTQLQKDYKQQQRYAKNITSSSRRIYNCFLFSQNKSPSQSNSIVMQSSIIKNSQINLTPPKKTKKKLKKSSKNKNFFAEEKNTIDLEKNQNQPINTENEDEVENNKDQDQNLNQNDINNNNNQSQEKNEQQEVEQEQDQQKISENQQQEQQQTQLQQQEIKEDEQI